MPESGTLPHATKLRCPRSAFGLPKPGLGGAALTPPGNRAIEPMKNTSRFVFGATTVATAAFFVAAATDQSTVPGLPREIVRTAWIAVAPILSSSVPKLDGISVRGILPKPHVANSAADTATTPIPAEAASAPTLANVTPPATAVLSATAVDPCGGQCVASKSSRPLPDKLTSAPRAEANARQGSPGTSDAEIAASTRQNTRLAASGAGPAHAVRDALGRSSTTASDPASANGASIAGGGMANSNSGNSGSSSGGSSASSGGSSSGSGSGVGDPSSGGPGGSAADGGSGSGSPGNGNVGASEAGGGSSGGGSADLAAATRDLVAVAGLAAPTWVAVAARAAAVQVLADLAATGAQVAVAAMLPGAAAPVATKGTGMAMGTAAAMRLAAGPAAAVRAVAVQVPVDLAATGAQVAVAAMLPGAAAPVAAKATGMATGTGAANAAGRCPGGGNPVR